MHGIAAGYRYYSLVTNNNTTAHSLEIYSQNYGEHLDKEPGLSKDWGQAIFLLIYSLILLEEAMSILLRL